MAEEKKITFGKIGNALKSVATDHIVTVAGDVFDEERQKYQSEVNTDIEEKIKEETEARDLAINNEAQARTQNDQLLSQAIAAEQKRAEAAEQAIIYDVSALNGGVAFESLSALLNSSDLSTLIPASVRHGGMTIRFIQGSEQSSDNKYVQCRLMTDSFTTDTDVWQVMTNEISAGSKNLVYSNGIYGGLLHKVDILCDINIIDYSQVISNKGINASGGLSTADGHSASGFIPVKTDDEIWANCYQSSSTSWSPIAVYDENFAFIRAIRGTQQYTYETGDAYIRIMFVGTTENRCYANRGTSLLSYTKFNPIGGYVADIKENVEKNNKQIDDLQQGTSWIEGELTGNIKRSFTGDSSYPIITNIPQGDITIVVSSSGNAYSRIYFYDKEDNLITSRESIYTTLSTPQTINLTLSDDCTKIVYLTIQNLTYDLEITFNTNGGLISRVNKNSEDISTIIKNTVSIPRATEGYDWKVDGLYSYEALISSDGTITRNANGSYMFLALYFIDENIKSVSIDTRAYISSGASSALYAFYNDGLIQDSTTVVDAGTLISGISTSDFHYNINVPAGAKVLVVAYSSTLDAPIVNGVEQLNLQVEKNTDKLDDLDIIPMSKVNNGTPILFAKTKDIINMEGKGYKATPEDWLLFRKLGSGTINIWICSPIFNPSDSSFVYVRFKIKFLSNATSFKLNLATGTSGADLKGTIADIPAQDGDYEFTFDPTYFRVYQSMTNKFCVWFYYTGSNGGIDVIISDIRIFQNESDALNLSMVQGNNTREMFKSVDENLVGIEQQANMPNFLVAPNGSRYELMVNNLGHLVVTSVIPSKAAFFGNSLIAGNSAQGISGFGMCASENTKDFFAKVNDFCLTLNPSYTAARNGAAAFEMITDPADIAEAVAVQVNKLAGDEDLIIIELGDNVASSSMDVFAQSSIALLQGIRIKCPNARVCWAGVWFSSAEKMQVVRNACRACGAILADISQLYTKENISTIGSLIDFGSVPEDSFTLDSVSSVVENSATNISVSFDYAGKQYSSTLDVASYSLSDTTLTYRSRYKIVTLQATHPGDRGMKAIANKILYTMGLTNSENYYSLD